MTTLYGNAMTVFEVVGGARGRRRIYCGQACRHAAKRDQDRQVRRELRAWSHAMRPPPPTQLSDTAVLPGFGGGDGHTQESSTEHCGH